MPLVVRASDAAPLREFIGKAEGDAWFFDSADPAGRSMGFYTRKELDDNAEDMEERFDVATKDGSDDESEEGRDEEDKDGDGDEDGDDDGMVSMMTTMMMMMTTTTKMAMMMVMMMMMVIMMMMMMTTMMMMMMDDDDR